MPAITITSFPDHSLSAFALASGRNRPFAPDSALGVPLHFIDSDDPTNLRFALLLNIINGVLYGGGMGMPQWVMLDLCLLPTMFVGVQGPARLLPVDMRAKIDAGLESYLNEGTPTARERLARGGMPDISGPLGDDELIPMAEFCAAASVDPTRIVGFSLYSLLPGLGTIAKSFGLAVHRGRGVTTQIGVAQYDNAALRTHTRFGALEIVSVLTPLHTKLDSTFTYALAIPSDDDLRRIADGGTCGESMANAQEVASNDIAALRVMDARHRGGTHQYYIAPPGNDTARGVTFITEQEIG